MHKCCDISFDMHWKLRVTEDISCLSTRGAESLRLKPCCWPYIDILGLVGLNTGSIFSVERHLKCRRSGPSSSDYDRHNGVDSCADRDMASIQEPACDPVPNVTCVSCNTNQHIQTGSSEDTILEKPQELIQYNEVLGPSIHRSARYDCFTSAVPRRLR